MPSDLVLRPARSRAGRDRSLPGSGVDLHQRGQRGGRLSARRSRRPPPAPKLLRQPHEEPRGEQGVSAELEEVVVHPDGRDAEQLARHRRNRLLYLVARRDVRGGQLSGAIVPRRRERRGPSALALLHGRGVALAPAPLGDPRRQVAGADDNLIGASEHALERTERLLRQEPRRRSGGLAGALLGPTIPSSP